MWVDVLTHGEPYTRFKRALPFLDLLLRERDWATAQKVNESHGEAVIGRKAEGRHSENGDGQKDRTASITANRHAIGRMGSIGRIGSSGFQDSSSEDFLNVIS